MNRGKLELLTRLGFAARGVMYVMIGVIALEAGRAEDGAGALEALNSGTGKLLLALMALGFAAYGAWRLADAALDNEGHGSDGKGLAMRLGGALSGLIHLGLAWIAAGMALGNRNGGGGDSAQEGAATALDLPGGWMLLLAAAAGLVLVGLYQLVNASKASFLRRLEGRTSSQTWVRVAGRVGYAARGIVFLIMAWFLGQAGLAGRAGEAGGMGEALDSLPQNVELAVAFGLFLFGLFSFVEARHRRLRDPAEMLPGHGGNGAVRR
ncbi:MAG TPA: DUF1206 domain-containing protein [Allosphingosinicella sp.]|nr:DUF1206 domain-containing protein [Allosphingosinicella sp.]